MIKLNHFTIPVADYSGSRNWYQRNLGLNVEFEIPERKTVALQDDKDLTLFLVESGSEHRTARAERLPHLPLGRTNHA